jgi:hypothetical protein
VRRRVFIRKNPTPVYDVWGVGALHVVVYMRIRIDVRIVDATVTVLLPVCCGIYWAGGRGVLPLLALHLRCAGLSSL